MNTTPIGDRNRIAGWALFLAGILGGMALGTWALDGPLPAPSGLEDYAALPRRFLRLAHIAAMALGLANVLYAREIDLVRLTPPLKRGGSLLMIASGVLMPLVLMASAAAPLFKWGLAVPAAAAAAAVALLLRGLIASRTETTP
jgi:hypothetical protein